ncbi:hypothetical protein QQZ08_007083 [Neonectria magnoliae]|uniref:CCHC-type domain-containing protein n=1 Tax=Neonectria magnoliae TaxID=2732573 RepID=A0ABR1HYX0_9HYPO
MTAVGDTLHEALDHYIEDANIQPCTEVQMVVQARTVAPYRPRRGYASTPLNAFRSEFGRRHASGDYGPEPKQDVATRDFTEYTRFTYMLEDGPEPTPAAPAFAPPRAPRDMLEVGYTEPQNAPSLAAQSVGSSSMQSAQPVSGFAAQTHGGSNGRGGGYGRGYGRGRGSSQGRGRGQVFGGGPRIAGRVTEVQPQPQTAVARPIHPGQRKSRKDMTKEERAADNRQKRERKKLAMAYYKAKSGSEKLPQQQLQLPQQQLQQLPVVGSATPNTQKEMEVDREVDMAIQAVEVEMEQEKQEKQQQQQPDLESNAVVCGNCKKAGHVLADCAHPSSDGYVHGCPLCNRGDHEISDCVARDSLSEWDTLHWGVSRRANRPPLAGFWDWVKVLRVLMDAEDEPPTGYGIPQRSPWSQEYTAAKCSSGDHRWSVFDYMANNPLEMGPFDTKTCHLRAVKENYPALAGQKKPVLNAALYSSEGVADVRPTPYIRDPLKLPNANGFLLKWNDAEDGDEDEEREDEEREDEGDGLMEDFDEDDVHF